MHAPISLLTNSFFILSAPLLGAVRQGCFAGTRINDVDIGVKEEQLPLTLKKMMIHK